jgi:archaemetzincin
MRYVYVGGTPEVDRETLATVSQHIARGLGVAVQAMDLPGVDFAFDSGRAQYASIPVLEMLARRFPADALKLLAVTERDLFIPVLTFVFGQAQLDGRVAVVSLARLRQEFYGLAQDQAIFLERAYKEALHEAGHLFGLVHCVEQRCAMSLSTNVRQIDWKEPAFCARCAAKYKAAEKPLADARGSVRSHDREGVVRPDPRE